jgi:hypothetical protein
MSTTVLALQRSAGNRAVAHLLLTAEQPAERLFPGLRVQRCSPKRSDSSMEEQDLQRLTATVQRDATDDLAAFIAKDLKGFVDANPPKDAKESAEANPQPYAHIREIFSKLDSDIEDNVAAAFVEMLPTAILEQFAASKAGLATLDVLSEAMLTGHVTSFEALQGARIVEAKGKVITSTEYQTETSRVRDLRHDAEDDSTADRAIDEQATQTAMQLSSMIGAHRYGEVTTSIREMAAGIEDNVASHLIELHTTPQLEQIAADSAGRTMLTVLYEAFITGSVSAFERLQGDRILTAIGKTAKVDPEAMARAVRSPLIFALATSWGSTATIRAELHDGKVKVWYDSSTGANMPEFRNEMATLRERFGWDAPVEGILLEPDEIVKVKLYDEDKEPEVPIPAIQLIDFFNRQKQDTLGKIEAVTALAATVGMGGVGAGGLLGWADTAAFAINAGSLIVNSYRKEIAQTALGKEFLDAWDFAQGVADYYGWGRLGVDGLKLVRESVAPALAKWRAEVPAGVTAEEGTHIAEAQAHAQEWLDGVKQGEAAEAAKLPGGAKEAHGAPGGGAVADVAGGETRRVVPGGEQEVHVTRERIEVCPVQRCVDLKESVGDAIHDDKVGPEVAKAEAARVAGDTAAAGELAITAVHDAEDVANKALTTVNKDFEREFISNPEFEAEWATVKKMPPGPEQVAAAREFRAKVSEQKIANDTYVADLRDQIDKLRTEAKADPDAVTHVRKLYETSPEWVLDDLKRFENEHIKARQQETRPRKRESKEDRKSRYERLEGERDPFLDEELAEKRAAREYREAQESDRMQHEAEVWIVDENGKEVHRQHVTSGKDDPGSLTKEQYAKVRSERGMNEANSQQHTEAIMLRVRPPGPGETMFIEGHYNPCRRCFDRMQQQVAEHGGTIVYKWPGGPEGGITFHGSTPPPYPSLGTDQYFDRVRPRVKGKS